MIGTKAEYTGDYLILAIFNNVIVFNFWLVAVKPHTVSKVASIIDYLNKFLLANMCFSSQFFFLCYRIFENLVQCILVIFSF